MHILPFPQHSKKRQPFTFFFNPTPLSYLFLQCVQNLAYYLLLRLIKKTITFYCFLSPFYYFLRFFSRSKKRQNYTYYSKSLTFFIFLYKKLQKKEIVKNTNKKYLFEVFIKNKYKIVIKTKKINQNL